MPKKPKLHKKPTPEELQANMDKAVEELEKDPVDPPVEPKETPPKKTEPKDPKPPKEDPPKEDPPVDTKKKTVDTTVDTKKETVDTTNGEPEDPPKEEEPDYKKKFTESTREAQILASKNKKLNEAIEKAGDVKDPTKKELRAEYSEWAEMSSFEKKIAKENLLNRKKFDAITEATKGFKDMDKWTEKVDKFMDNPETLANYPELEGKEAQFKLFSTKPTRRGVDFVDLVNAFMYEEDSKPKKPKGSMFEQGSGGLNEKPKPKSDKITIEESITLRNTDYKKYLQYVKDGKIDTSEL